MMCVFMLQCLQMSLARADSGGTLFQGPVVVLADMDKEEMDDIVSKQTSTCIMDTRPLQHKRAIHACCTSNSPT